MHTIWLYSIGSVGVVSVVSLIGIFALTLGENLLKKLLLFLVSFSAGALLGDAFLHLIPEVSEVNGFGIQQAMYILAGILIFFALEKFICWRHCHVVTSEDHPHPFATMNLIGDIFHNFLDGLIIAGTYTVNIPLGITTTIAVLLHEIPQEIGDFGVLLHGGFSRKKALILNFIVALSAVLGAVSILAMGPHVADAGKIIVPFTAGGFIYIAGSDLIPELHKETKPLKSLIQLLSISLGIFIMWGMLFLDK